MSERVHRRVRIGTDLGDDLGHVAIFIAPDYHPKAFPSSATSLTAHRQHAPSPALSLAASCVSQHAIAFRFFSAPVSAAALPDFDIAGFSSRPGGRADPRRANARQLGRAPVTASVSVSGQNWSRNLPVTLTKALTCTSGRITFLTSCASGRLASPVSHACRFLMRSPSCRQFQSSADTATKPIDCRDCHQCPAGHRATSSALSRSTTPPASRAVLE